MTNHVLLTEEIENTSHRCTYWIHICITTDKTNTKWNQLNWNNLTKEHIHNYKNMKDNFYHSYEKNNHSTNVYKTKKHLSSQTLEKKKKKDHDTWHWKFSHRLGTVTKYDKRIFCFGFQWTLKQLNVWIADMKLY